MSGFRRYRDSISAILRLSLVRITFEAIGAIYHRVRFLKSTKDARLSNRVVTAGVFNGGTKNNIIPDVVQLQLTVRSYKPEVRKHPR